MIKRLFIPLVATLGLMVSCNTKQVNEDLVSKLIHERDSLKNEYRKIGKQLVKLETRLADLDTNRRLTPVTVMTIEEQPFSHYFEVYGSVHAMNDAVLSPEMPGTIQNIRVKEGQHVKKGDVLLVLDDEVLSNNIEEVKTQLALAKQVYEKQKALWDKNIGSELQYLQAKTNYEALQKKLESLESQRGKTMLTAPYDGVVDEIFAKEGALSGPQVPALRLVNLNAVYLKADIPENYYKVIRKGVPVSIEFTSLGITIDTVVSETGYYINKANRTFSVNIEFDNSSQRFLPNMLGLVKVKDYHADATIAIPASLVQEDAEGNSFVYVIEYSDEGVPVVETREVVTGPTYQGKTEIKEGLRSGEMLIVKGARNVADGQRVEILK